MKYEKKLYSLGKLVGLRKEEIDEIIHTVSDTKLSDSKMLSLQEPTEEYPPSGKYGTISIRDLSNDTYTPGTYYGTISIKHFNIKDI